MMVEAGFRRVFIGIETPVPASLQECQKYQNTHGDLVEMIRTIQRSGLEVMGGFIVGFDNDPREIFELQFDFIQKTGIAAAMVGLLSALPKTQLYHRLLGEGRLDAVTTGNNTEAVLNFIPKLDREFLIDGYRRLMRTLYEPTTYYRRVLTFLAEYRPSGPKLPLTLRDVRAFVKSLWIMGVLHHGRPRVLEVSGDGPASAPAETAVGDVAGDPRVSLSDGGKGTVAGMVHERNKSARAETEVVRFNGRRRHFCQKRSPS